MRRPNYIDVVPAERMARAGDLVRASQGEPASRKGKRKDAVTEEYFAAVFNALAYLEKYTSYAVPISSMAATAKRERDAQANRPELDCPTDRELRAYVMGYAAPLFRASVDASRLMPAAVAYVGKRSDWPKSPAPLISLARLAASAEEAEYQVPEDPKALDAPAVRPETIAAIRERHRKL